MDKAYTPGKYLVEVFPFLKHVPEWVPGAQWKRDVAAWKVTIADTRNKLFNATLEFMVRWSVFRLRRGVVLTASSAAEMPNLASFPV